ESRARLGSEVPVGDHEPSFKEKSVHPQSLPNQVEGFLNELDVLQGAGDGPQQLKTVAENAHSTYGSQPMLGSEAVQNGHWIKRAPSWNTDLDALMLDDVVLERAYVVRVADQDGWDIVSKIVAEDALDPMAELMGGKHERSRLAAQHFSKPKKPRSAYQPCPERA
ncbi:13681_t:CDS:2, partial [Racocetra fulgida]